jgi:hypothetical protein
LNKIYYEEKSKRTKTCFRFLFFYSSCCLNSVLSTSEGKYGKKNNGG